MAFICPNCYTTLSMYKGKPICPKMGCRGMSELTQVQEKTQQRFGRLVRGFGDFGELRKQKKSPFVEVLYIPVKVPAKFPKSLHRSASRPNEILRAVMNCTSEQISDFIKKVGANLEGGNVTQANAEFLLDACYAELNKRLNP